MTDYTCWGTSELIERIHELEAKLAKGSKTNALREKYDAFAREWASTHKISNPPSFSSWKTHYRNKK